MKILSKSVFQRRVARFRLTQYQVDSLYTVYVESGLSYAEYIRRTRPVIERMQAFTKHHIETGIAAMFAEGGDA